MKIYFTVQTLYIHGLHSTCLWSTLYPWSTLCTTMVYTLHTRDLHSAYPWSTLCTLMIYTMHTYDLSSAHLWSTLCAPVVYTLHTHGLCSAHLWSTFCAPVVYTLHACGLLDPQSQVLTHNLSPLHISLMANSPGAQAHVLDAAVILFLDDYSEQAEPRAVLYNPWNSLYVFLKDLIISNSNTPPHKI